MRPSSAELLARIAETLELEVMPAVGEDRWAASSLRSATTLLLHLAKRVQQELPILLADNADAAATLQKIAAEPRPEAANPAVFSAVLDTLAKPTAVVEFDLESQELRNREYQAIMDRLLRECHACAQMQLIHAELRHYFKRRTARERELYFPVFSTGAPF